MLNSPVSAPAPETILVANDADQVSCDGGGGALGHPKVWYSFDKQDVVECSYCDRRFVKDRASS
ncbi:MAG: zinc-finger domain-containing protein [Alphaproteobacteria bacterium]|nr:zinc-finger domain-containing protein [Alphaproteobacteria bacterium]